MRERDADRLLTEGEVKLLASVFGSGIDYARVRVHSERWSVVFPPSRAMAPNGQVYLPGPHYAHDFSDPRVPLGRRSVFVHEGAHLFQWYGLDWTVWLRGPFDRRYTYALVPGRRFQEYGLEAMGMIAQHYYTLREGGRISLPYTLDDYRHLLPLAGAEVS